MNTQPEPQSHWPHQPPLPGGQRSSSNSLKMNEGRFTLDVRKSVTMRVVREWNRFLGEVAGVPSTEIFKAELDVALRPSGKCPCSW